MNYYKAASVAFFMSKITPVHCIFFIFLCLAWLGPYKTYPWVAFYSDFNIFFSFLIIGIILIKNKTIKITHYHVVMLLLAFFPILQILIGVNIFYGDAIIAFMYLIGLFYCFTLGTNLKNNYVFDVIVYSILFSCFISVFIALSQWLSIDWNVWFFSESQQRAFANFGQPNQLATFLCWGIIGGTWLLWTDKIRIIVYVCIIGLFSIGIAITYSRAAHFTILFICLLLFFYRKTSKYDFYLSLLVFIVYIAINVTVFNLSDILNTYSRNIESVNDVGPRKVHWLAALDAIKKAPFFGYGWNQVSVAMANTVLNHESSHEFIEHSHNLIFDLLIWNGVAVGLAIIGFLILFLVKNIKQNLVNQKISILMVVAVMPHSMLEFPLEYAYMLLPVGFFMGFLENRSPALKIQNNIFCVFLVIFATVMIFVFIEYKNIEERYQVLRFQSAGIATIELENKRTIFFDQHEKFLEFASTEAYVGMSEEKIAMMDAVSLRFGYPPVLFRHALASALNGNIEKAEHSLLRICKTARKDICVEAQENWLTLQKKYKELKGANFPRLAD